MGSLCRAVAPHGAKNKKAQKNNGIVPRFWLTGKLYCGHCKSTMNGVSGNSSTGKTYYYYVCNESYKRKRGNGCKKKAIRKEVLECMVEY